MRLKSVIVFVCFSAFILLFLMGLVGCHSVKKSQVSEESKTVLKVDTVFKEKHDTVHVTKTETKTESNTEFVFDTIYREIPQIIYRTDGSVEVKGLKTANLQLSYWQKKYDSLSDEYEVERGKTIYWQDEAKKVTTVVKKEGSMWLFFIGMALGVILTVLFVVWLNKKYFK